MKSLCAVFLAVLIMAAAGPAAAQAVCGLRAAMLRQLGGNYKEAVVAMGLASNGAVLEVTRSDSGSWTILLTNPSGVTCLMAAGENWETIKPTIKREPS
ncbi:MAG: hypothetical protein HQ483_18410 [Rhodospirillales bacterium]|nr:hypothetical protein [Rhodospirillales bacterium]